MRPRKPSSPPRLACLARLASALLSLVLATTLFSARASADPTVDAATRSVGRPDAATSADARAPSDPAHTLSDASAKSLGGPELDATAPTSAASVAPSVAPAGHVVAPSAPSASSVPVVAVSPSASASAFASTSGVGSAAVQEAPPDGAPVRLRDRKIFVLRASRGGVGAVERARKASTALDAAFEKGLAGEVKIDDSEAGLAAIVVDGTRVVELTAEDAKAAGDPSLTIHASLTAETVRAAFAYERTRRDVATTVFHWSLVVFTGLLGFLVQRRIRRFLRAGRIWLRRHPERVPAFRVARVDLVRPTALLGLLQLTAAFLDRLVQGAVLYVWLVFALSLFDRTRGASSAITGFVVEPVKAFAARIAAALPGFVALAVAFVLLGVAVRFVGQVDRAVERGEAELPGLSRDHTKPVLVLLRLAMVLFALLVGAPLVTGSDDAVVSRIGLGLVGALALSASPLLASAAVGLVTLFSGRFRVGEFVSYEGRQGRIVAVNVLELRMRDGEGAEMRIPHLLSLTRDVRVMGPYRLASFEIVVDPSNDLEQVRRICATAATGRHGEPRVRLLGLHAKGARFEIVARRADGEDDAATAVAKALRDAGIALGADT